MWTTKDISFESLCCLQPDHQVLVLVQQGEDRLVQGGPKVGWELDTHPLATQPNHSPLDDSVAVIGGRG